MTSDNVTDNHHDDTRRYAGPFCACGDYSCPASDDPAAQCVYADL